MRRLLCSYDCRFKLSSTFQDMHVLQSWTVNTRLRFNCTWLSHLNKLIESFILGSYTGALTATFVIWVPELKHTKHSQCSGVPRSTRRVKGYIITFHCFNNTRNDFIRNQRVLENASLRWILCCILGCITIFNLITGNFLTDGPKDPTIRPRMFESRGAFPLCMPFGSCQCPMMPRFIESAIWKYQSR